MFVDTQARPQGETAEQTNRKLKLSEAIRIGATKRPQCKGHFFDGVGTCALGAAAEARGWKPKLNSVFGVSPYTFLPESKGTLGGTISVMNDCGESRERIADWLEAQGF